jgi:hypothetical protein
LDEIFGFNYQDHSGNCGQWALLNILLILGSPISNKDAHEKTKTSKLDAWINGTDEKRIKKALRKFGCKPEDYNIFDENELKIIIDKYLTKNIPLIISVSDYQHWNVLACKKADRYYWIDSSEESIIGFCKWDAIVEWMQAKDKQPFYFIAVHPSANSYPIKNIDSLYRISINNEWLFFNYGRTLRDLLDILTSDNNKPDKDAAILLNKHKDNVVSNIVYLYENADEEDLYEMMDNYITLAKMHNIKYSGRNEVEVLIRLTIMLTFYMLDIE